MMKKPYRRSLLFNLLLMATLAQGCSIPMRILDTTANVLTKTATTTIKTTGDVLKAGAGLASDAANKVGAAAPLAAALAAQPVAPPFIP